MLCLRLMLLAGIVIALSACAKGASDAQSDLQLPVAPQLNLSADLKQLRFKWAVVNHASYYKLLQNSDGRSGYTQLGGNLTATNAVVDIAVHRQDWLRARYIVEASNELGCTASESIGVASAMLQTIGYAKASNTGVSDRLAAHWP